MRLTWKDAVATLLIGAVVAVCAVFVNGTSVWLIGSIRGATAVVLVLGLGGCALGSVDVLYQGAQRKSAQVVKAIVTPLGVAALLAGVTGLITGSAYALAMLVTATIMLWLIATIGHLLTALRQGPVAGRDEHEVIDPQQTARH